jgi:hypothetical protein
MEVSEITQAPEDSVTDPSAYERCEQCGTAVDRAQRYCVVCGAHRRSAHDPAARYLSQATARSRALARAAAAPAGAPAARRWSPGIGTALLLAALPLAVAIGVMIGKSSTNNDAKLIAALRAQRADTITQTVAATAAVAATAHAVKNAKGAKHAHKASQTLSTKNAGKALSKTRFGTAHQLTGQKVSQAQLNQGAQVVKHEQQSAGKSYVSSQRGLPDQVSVP